MALNPYASGGSSLNPYAADSNLGFGNASRTINYAQQPMQQPSFLGSAERGMRQTPTTRPSSPVQAGWKSNTQQSAPSVYSQMAAMRTAAGNASIKADTQLAHSMARTNNSNVASAADAKHASYFLRDDGFSRQMHTNQGAALSQLEKEYRGGVYGEGFRAEQLRRDAEAGTSKNLGFGR